MRIGTTTERASGGPGDPIASALSSVSSGDTRTAKDLRDNLPSQQLRNRPEFQGGLRGEFQRPPETTPRHDSSGQGLAGQGGVSAGTRPAASQAGGSRAARSVVTAQRSPAEGGAGSKPSSIRNSNPDREGEVV
ncbi:hypothetical protein ElyMa_004544100 [Elysia marginata]|uniref:Uncharacterized protein n=1 Tax=Elysia marginata TaxID=1093978 RepID=A0AAV4HS92_9GAST|nr:hypothetical protein ElyMa_004544100 [Elysia marginata]